MAPQTKCLRSRSLPGLQGWSESVTVAGDSELTMNCDEQWGPGILYIHKVLIYHWCRMGQACRIWPISSKTFVTKVPLGPDLRIFEIKRKPCGSEKNC